MSITPEILVEELVAAHPNAVALLIQAGLPCVVCGEMYWGTLAELAASKGFSPEQTADLVEKLNAELPSN